jgi:epoxyqueuosine reductase
MTDRRALTERIKAAGREAGFVRVGVAEASRLEEEAARLDAWLDAGRHAQMAWMKDTADVRKDPRDPRMVAGAKSIIVMAAPYAHQGEYEGPAPARVAKYALGRDYHNVLTKKARRVVKLLEAAGHRARVAVDSKPVFERAWAERAGVGFIGKNCCLIVPGVGSHVFLACVVTTAALAADEPIGRRCGSCTLCLEACPTNAFVEPRALDARRCISYLTIEHRGAIPEEHRRGIGPWLFGCDVCQDVCPYNRGGTPESMEAFEPRARWAEVELADFLGLDEEGFRSWSEGSPLRRGGRDGLARNAALVLGNRGDAVHLAVLDQASRAHPSPVVREAASWAHDELNHRLTTEEGSTRGPPEEA